MALTFRPPNPDLLVLTWHLEVSTMCWGHYLTPLCILPYALSILSPPACCPHQTSIILLMYSRKSSLHSHAFNVILWFPIAPCPGPHFSTDGYKVLEMYSVSPLHWENRDDGFISASSETGLELDTWWTCGIFPKWMSEMIEGWLLTSFICGPPVWAAT